jgi:three-Cys-motif partner protein
VAGAKLAAWSDGMKGQQLVQASDGDIALLTGAWSADKHDYIHRLAHIFSTGMKNRWPYRNLIDLFSGPGLCVVEGTGEEIPGTPLQAINIPDLFTNYYLNDINPASIAALKRRISQLNSNLSVQYFINDCNHAVEEILSHLPPPNESVDLAIIDPWSWEISFDSLTRLTANRRMDVVVTFPMGFIKRNWRNEIAALDRFLGGQEYKEPFFAAMSYDRGKAARILLDYFASNLHRIGYSHINDKIWVPNSRHVKLYHLVFASKHVRGDDFWSKITKRSPQGQITLL